MQKLSDDAGYGGGQEGSLSVLQSGGSDSGGFSAAACETQAG
jgi:hypothetical protein